MPISKRRLDGVVRAWNVYAEQRPRKIKARDLLLKRDINMYRGLGITNAHELASRMVEDRSIASIEMTMGYLYERVLEEHGPKKVTRHEKQRSGYREIDFTDITPEELRLINLKAGLSTSNGDITTATKRNLKEAKQHWENSRERDDNPLAQRKQRVVMVRAVARGPSKCTLTEDGILWLVGESMWKYFGAGDGFLAKLSEAMARNPLDYGRYNTEKDKATERVLKFLRDGKFVNAQGAINWRKLIEEFP